MPIAKAVLFNYIVSVLSYTRNAGNSHANQNAVMSCQSNNKRFFMHTLRNVVWGSTLSSQQDSDTKCVSGNCRRTTCTGYTCRGMWR